MAQSKFKGTGVAIVTPFRKDKSIDFKALTSLVERCIDENISYLVVMGTTGESATLNADEKEAVLNHVKEINNKRVPVVVGIGGNNTQELLNNIKSADFDGIDGILSVAPYYNKPSQTGLYEHYRTIAAASPVDVILYNVPGRTSVNISAETTLKLAHEVDNIVAIKEASGDLGQIMQIIKNKPDGFAVVSGDDPITLPMIAAGGEGVISVVANAYPGKFSDMVRFALDNKFDQARNILFQLIDLIEHLFIDGNPAGVKCVLALQGICEQYLRLPLTPVSPGIESRIKKLVDEIK